MAAPKKTPEQIRHAHAEILKHIEKERKTREKKGYTFTSVTPEELEKKLNRTESPIIINQGWTTNAKPGGIINYDVGVSNPDPFMWEYLVASISVGARNPIRDTGMFLNDYDRRFPTMAQPHPTGLTLAAGAFTTFSFQFPVPVDVPLTDYFGNTVLFQMNFHDLGTYLDRAVFFFGVV